MRKRTMGVSSPIRKRSKTNVRPSVRRLSEGSKENEKNGNSSHSSSASSMEQSSSPLASSHNAWNPLHIGSSEGDRTEQWMFIENKVGKECGIEVRCTMSTPRAQDRHSPPPKEEVKPTSQQEARKRKGRKSLLKHDDQTSENESAKPSKSVGRWSKSLGGKHLKLKKANNSIQ